MITNYRDLLVWKMAYSLTLDIYRITQSFPRHELFGLTSQLRRAAVSVVSNIAEGNFRRSKKEYQYLLNVARASCAELETQIDLAKDLMYIPASEWEKTKKQIEPISKILYTIYNKLY